MARSAKIYDFTIQPNGSFTLLVEGSFYRIQSSTGALEVRRDGGSGVGPIYAGQGEREEEFKRLTLVDKSGSINKGFICVSDGSFVDDRVTGSVEVIDGEKSRVLADSVYSASPAFSAVNFATIQLWNPAASQKNIVVTNMVYGLNSAGGVIAYPSNTQLTTDVTSIRSGNMRIGGPIGVAQSRTQDMGAAYAYASGSLSFQNAAAGAQYAFPNKNPFVIPPGWGLNLTTTTAGLTIGATMIYVEEAIL